MANYFALLLFPPFAQYSHSASGKSKAPKFIRKKIIHMRSWLAVLHMRNLSVTAHG